MRPGKRGTVTTDFHSFRLIGETAREEAIRIPVESVELAATLICVEEPVRDTGIVFVHGWSGNRLGPHGILATIARRCGREGIPSLRFDFRGRGESGGEGMNVSLSTMADDLVRATEFFRKRAGVRKVVLVGICSGGNVAVGTLPRFREISGLVLLSVYPFSDGDSFGRDVGRFWHFFRVYLKKAGQRETWRRLFAGELHLGRVLQTLFGHFFRKNEEKEGSTPGDAPEDTSPGKVARAAEKESRSADEDAPKQYLAGLNASTPAVMVYGTADPDAGAAQEYFEQYAGESDWSVEFVTISGANHNFSSAAWTEQIAGLTVDFVEKSPEHLMDGGD